MFAQALLFGQSEGKIMLSVHTQHISHESQVKSKKRLKKREDDKRRHELGI